MRTNRPFRFARLAMLLAALGVNLLPGSMIAYAADAPKAAAPAEEMLRPEFAAPVKAYQDLFNAKDYKGALAKVVEMEAIPNLTPFEKYKIERMRIPAASSAGDNALTMKTVELVLNSERLNNSEFLSFSQSLASMKYNAEDYAGALVWLEKYFKAGGKDEKVRQFYLQNLYFSKNYTKTMSETQIDINADIAAGKKPSELVLKLALESTIKLDNKPAYLVAATNLLTFFPQRELWDDVLGRFFSNTANSDRWVLNYYRLKTQMNLMAAADEYMDMAELAMRAGQPGEAKRVLEQGFQSGMLGKTGDVKKQTALRDRANKIAADDIKTLDQADSVAAKAKEGSGLVNLGYALVVNGKTDKGIALIEQGLKLGTKKADEAKMLAGIAYATVGRKDDALKMLAQVQSNDGGTELARFWTMQVSNPIK
jgi:hypothetical protein